jgi:surface polysaccharide O-acyltransferase-like enzyme
MEVKGMDKTKEYKGIDYFRVIAAMLIIAIHTSPLSSVNDTADFVFTRIIARIGVPFFFMTTGFFLLPQYIGKTGPRDNLIRFFKKVLRLYAIAILLYLPVNIYAGYFNDTSLFPKIIKDVVFDGTFYHLWYLPAVIMGVGIVYVLLKMCKPKNVFYITVMLYVVGLFGDSYYGIAQKIPFLKSSYDLIFKFSDYTRNGIFFAPIFLFLGGMIGKSNKRVHVKKHVMGLIVSTILLLSEGLCLNHFSLQRHDSMYFMLLPCMYFLFQLVLLWQGRSKKILRKVSMCVYLVHPFFIILVRGFAKLTDLSWLLIDNSIVHYLMVVITSFIFSFFYSTLKGGEKNQF